MNNSLNINHNLDNLENILKQNLNSNRLVNISFENKHNKTIKIKKPTKENILRLKEKLESFESIMTIKFKDFFIYKELLFSCENLKCFILDFHNCSFEEGTKEEVVKLFNKCSCIRVIKKFDKILFYVFKNYFRKMNHKKLCLRKVDYKSIKTIFFGIYLSILELKSLETTEREIRKILKSLQATVNLRIFIYDNEKAHGLIYNRKKNIKSPNMKPNELKEEVELEVKYSVKLRFKVEKANEIFLSSLPNWINEVEIKSKYKKEDYKYLLTKFYKEGILNKSKYRVKCFGDLTKQTEIDLLEYVTKLK